MQSSRWLTPRDADTILAVALAEDFAADSPPPRLTRAQVAKVHSLIIDEGYSRAEALGEVRS